MYLWEDWMPSRPDDKDWEALKKHLIERMDALRNLIWLFWSGS